MIYDKSKTIIKISYSSLLGRILAVIFGKPVRFCDGRILGYKFGKSIFLLKGYCNGKDS